MRVRVDKDLCTGHARCWTLTPEVFTIDDLGYSDLHAWREVPTEFEERARAGTQACPERALQLEE